MQFRILSADLSRIGHLLGQTILATNEMNDCQHRHAVNHNRGQIVGKATISGTKIATLRTRVMQSCWRQLSRLLQPFADAGLADTLFALRCITHRSKSGNLRRCPRNLDGGLPFLEDHLVGFAPDADVEAFAAHRAKLNAHQPFDEITADFSPRLLRSVSVAPRILRPDP